MDGGAWWDAVWTPVPYPRAGGRSSSAAGRCHLQTPARAAPAASENFLPSRPSPRNPESPKQDKPKAKHPKTHINQINKDQTQRTNMKSSKEKTTNTSQKKKKKKSLPPRSMDSGLLMSLSQKVIAPHFVTLWTVAHQLLCP